MKLGQLKETRISYFCVTPQNQALHKSASLAQITQKILTKDIIHWLEWSLKF